MFDFNEIAKHWRRQDEYLERLRLDPPDLDSITVGSRVLFAGGLTGRGPVHVRIEATVIECGDTSYKLTFENLNRREEEWIHQDLITDILGDREVTAAAGEEGGDG